MPVCRYIGRRMMTSQWPLDNDFLVNLAHVASLYHHRRPPIGRWQGSRTHLLQLCEIFEIIQQGRESTFG